jgi:hypothetical protein
VVATWQLVATEAELLTLQIDGPGPINPARPPDGNDDDEEEEDGEEAEEHGTEVELAQVVTAPEDVVRVGAKDWKTWALCATPDSDSSTRPMCGTAICAQLCSITDPFIGFTSYKHTHKSTIYRNYQKSFIKCSRNH